MDQYMASASKQLLGTETVAEMRSKGVKSIICGLSANDIRDSFVGAGANEFVLKPIPCKPDSLRAVLTKLVNHQKISPLDSPTILPYRWKTFSTSILLTWKVLRLPTKMRLLMACGS